MFFTKNLFKEQTEEALDHVKTAKTTLKSFKDLFFNQRNILESYFAYAKEFKPWDFTSEMLFSRSDMFPKSSLKIEVLLIIYAVG